MPVQDVNSYRACREESVVLFPLRTIPSVREKDGGVGVIAPRVPCRELFTVVSAPRRQRKTTGQEETGMQKQIIPFTLFAVICCWGFSVQAASLGFSPADQSVDLGDQVSTDVVFFDPGGALVGAYDIVVEFDPSVLSFNDVLFGSALGAPLDSLQAVVEIVAGDLNVAELSFLFDFSALQDGVSDVTLFSVVFDTVQAGTSALGLRGNVGGDPAVFLGDEFGFPLPVDGVAGGRINVNARPQVVPEPEVLLLLAFGLGWVLLRGVSFRA